MDANAPMPSSEEQERQRRQQALSALAARHSVGDTPPGASAHPPRPAQRPPAHARRWLALLTLVAVICAGSLAAYTISRSHTSAPPSARPPIPALLQLIPTGASAHCPTALTWSPDSQRLAAQRSACLGDPPSLNTGVTVFDARTGTPLRSFDIASTLARLGANNASSYAPTWSGDGKTLIIPITYDSHYGATANTYHTGLLLQPAAGGAARLLRGSRISDTPNAAPGDATIDPFGVWNLTTSQQIPIAIATHGLLPPATSYQWAANGQISIATPATPSPSDGATVFSGSPTQRRASATIPLWQPGYIIPVAPHDSAGVTNENALPLAYFYQAAPTLQSPDGRYVAPTQALAARIPAPGASAPLTAAQCLGNGYSIVQICASAPISLPDKAFAAVLATMAQGAQRPGDAFTPPTTTYSDAVAIAWRPDGALLAAILPGDGFQNAAPQAVARVTLYDTKTGQRLATLTSKRSVACAYSSDRPLLAWSPSGQQLALHDFCSGSITVWGAGYLDAPRP